MAKRMEAGQYSSEAVWRIDARNYLDDFGVYQAVEWIDTGFVIRWLEPFSGNEDVVGYNVAFNDVRRQALIEAAANIAQALKNREKNASISLIVPEANSMGLALMLEGESRDHPIKFPAKQRFYADLQDWLESRFSPEQRLLVIGDLNISPEDSDIGIGPDNAKRWLRTGKCSFLPEEREWLGRLKHWGLVDSFRHLNPDSADRFSWFDYRSRGFEDHPKRGLRIDLIMASRGLIGHCVSSDIDYQIRGMEKPSDHAPVWAEFEL
ncbi:MAG: hypothetical protein B7X58_09205 [Marinobacter sp. 34-60-7]|nr:MAG: hypothetical protein B7X58_09205 [Marinobacter sp. 34-60-7]